MLATLYTIAFFAAVFARSQNGVALVINTCLYRERMAMRVFERGARLLFKITI